mmetsp:Transcript_5136/g.12459  ORF Transcript_5136/g.12459 Transcript_5136/m.12459 type:complete len:639 (-) Transcript_5136:173-2089(-)
MDGKKRLTSKAKAFNPKAKTFNPNAKTFNPKFKAGAKTFNPSAQVFKPQPRAFKSQPAGQPQTGNSRIPKATSAPPAHIVSGHGAPGVSHNSGVAQHQTFIQGGAIDGAFTQEGAAKGAFYMMQGQSLGMDSKMNVQTGQWGVQQQAQQGVSQPMQPVGYSGVMGMQGMMQYGEPMGMQGMEGFDWEEEREEQKRILLPLRRPVKSFFMPQNLAEDYAHQTRLLTARLQPEHRDFYRLPITVDHERYHSLWPFPPNFDPTPTATSSHCYKVTSTKDGIHYVLRRVVVNRSEKYAAKAIAPWIHIHKLANGAHPNIVPVRTVFESQDFDEGKCLCFIYDYYPGAVPIATQYQIADAKQGLPGRGLVAEPILWSFLLQLLSSLTSVHPHGLAALNINPFRVLVQANRLRINFCGVSEALQLVPTDKTLAELQFEDLRNICQLLMSISCRSFIQGEQLEKRAFEVMKLTYSEDLIALFKFVLFTEHNKQKLPTVWDVQSLCWHRLVDELQQTYIHIDYMHNQLAKEHQNGRLFSLVSKLGFITERPEHRNDPRWSETGDRYLVKLFRDFIFHTVDEEGRPQVDLGHVVNCLNKLDAASPEKTLLTSRNQDSMLIVSYKELNRCIRAAFQELLEASEAKIQS